MALKGNVHLGPNPFQQIKRLSFVTLASPVFNTLKGSLVFVLKYYIVSKCIYAVSIRKAISEEINCNLALHLFLSVSEECTMATIYQELPWKNIFQLFSFKNINVRTSWEFMRHLLESKTNWKSLKCNMGKVGNFKNTAPNLRTVQNHSPASANECVWTRDHCLAFVKQKNNVLYTMFTWYDAFTYTFWSFPYVLLLCHHFTLSKYLKISLLR